MLLIKAIGKVLMVFNKQLIYSSIHVLYTLGARDFSCASGFGQGMCCSKRADFRRI